MTRQALEPRYRQFACPQEVAEESFFSTVTIAQGQAIAQVFIDHYREELAARSEGIPSLVELWLEGKSDFDTVWDMAFGRAHHALESTRLDPVEAGARLALRLTAAGTPGRWRADIHGVIGLRWARWLLPAADMIEVESNGLEAQLVLRRNDGTRDTLAFTGGPTSWHTDDAPSLMYIGASPGIALLPAHAVPPDVLDAEGPSCPVGVSEVRGEDARAYEDGLRLVAQYAPAYRFWIERVLRSIMVCRYENTRTRSGSWEDTPGLIHASATENSSVLGEILVHEASHQYFHLLWRLGPLDNGSDQGCYYSPAVERKRPLSRILIAYHAFANVLLFYRACMTNGIDDEACARNVARLRTEVAQLAEPLRDNPALTHLGRALCEPLMERLS